MARTVAERQAAWRERRAEWIASARAEISRLRAANDDLTAALEVANEEISRLSALPCPHPAERIDNGRCTGCGEWL